MVRAHRDRAWSGLRPSTPDLHPLLGPWPPDPRVLLATGHEGLGVTTALATGELLGALLTDRSPPIPLEPYLPARFLPGGWEKTWTWND
jgi:glycine/D-amino acid oxidase-like deaminating enzyme